MKIILASKSPRRREILESLGIKFDVLTCDTDESCNIKDPSEFVRELALRKGKAVEELVLLNGKNDDDSLIIAADTVVYADGEILGKPRDRHDAHRMLSLLSGKEHSVISGICTIYKGKAICSHSETKVTFAPLSDSEIDAYIASGEPNDKAGAYAIQGLASVFIRKIDGCYFNVVGLPTNRLYEMILDGFGIDIRNI